MAKPGPRPLPTNIREFRGSRKRDSSREPKPPIVVPPAPEWMKEAHQLVWQENAEILARMRVMTEADYNLLAMYVETWVRWLAAINALNDAESTTTAPTGYVIKHPMLAIVNKAQDQLLRISNEFGFSPASRVGKRMEP